VNKIGKQIAAKRPILEGKFFTKKKEKILTLVYPPRAGGGSILGLKS